MAVKSYKLGPGTLELGTAPLDVSGQVRACRVNPTENVTTGETIPVLTGEELRGDDEVTHSSTLEATLLQDLTAAGFIDFSYTNAGAEVPFRFVPSTAEGREVSGTVRVVPIAIGGDVRSRPTSDISWTITDPGGLPTFGAIGV